MTTRNMEDYLEAIWNLQNKKGYVKAKDIAERLEVSRPSVSEMIKKLKINFPEVVELVKKYKS